MAGAVEIADAYVALYVKAPGIEKDIENQLAGASGAGAKPGQSIGDNLMNGMGSVVKGGVVALGGLAAAGLGTALVKGFQRLDALDQAEAKLAGLGHTTQSIETIMDSALASVKGTAFGMGDAATVAASTVAAGVEPGEELERTLKLVGDAATIAGTDMSTMGSIVNKVATSDMMQMDVANQLMDAGIPILQMVADEMGITAEEARKMASEGKISFDTFQDALEGGLGGAALESGSTFQGAMDNVMASLGRLGESLLGGAFEGLKGGFGDLTTTLDDLQPTFEAIGTKVGEFASVAIPALIDGLKNTVQWLQDAGQWIQDNKAWLEPLAVAIGAAAAAFVVWHGAIGAWNKITAIAKGVQLAFNAVMAANPIMLIVMAIAALVAGLIYFFTQTELGQEIWANFTQFLSEAWTNITNFLSETWENITTWFTEFGEGIATGWNDLWAGVGQFFTDTWENIKTFFSDALQWLVDLFLNWTLLGLIISNWDNIVQFFGDSWENIKTFFSDALNGIGQWWDDMWNGAWDLIKTIFGGIADFIGNAFQSVLNIVKAPINGFIDLINSVINGLNSISVDVPDWVPSIGGQTWSLGIPNIPRLAEGGVVSRRPGGILANIGEGRYDEAVIPLSPQILAQLGGGGRPIEVHVHAQPGMSEETVGILAANKVSSLLRG